PVASRVTPPEGATFAGVMIGPPESLHLVASDAGYGFIAKLEDLCARNKSGKVVLNLPAGAGALAPAPVSDPAGDRVAMASSGGRLLVAPVSDLPVMARGKGLKILHIPGAKLKAREEFVVAMTVIREGEGLVVHSGKRTLTLKPGDLEPFLGE